MPMRGRLGGADTFLALYAYVRRWTGLTVFPLLLAGLKATDSRAGFKNELAVERARAPKQEPEGAFPLQGWRLWPTRSFLACRGTQPLHVKVLLCTLPLSASFALRGGTAALV